MDTENWVPVIGFGDRLRIVRRTKRRTQDEMAALLGVKKVTYASWEAGIATPPHGEVVKIAHRLYVLDRVPEWWTLGAHDPTDTLSVRTRSSTDRASDYGSGVGPFRPARRRSDRRRHRHLAVVPLPLPLRIDAAIPA